ncbi:MAG: 2-C-methyl-D-erythritol 2,4-cyclodiphosphate synthase [Candidatus Dormibacteria bacterium]
MTLRIGHGIDAHKFAPGSPLYLGGIHIPSGVGLEGHSDGDAALHALAHALLGAAHYGDMGKFFPSSEERWKGVSSSDLLARVNTMVVQYCQIVSAQVVIVAQRPRLSEHLSDMERHISEILSVPTDAIAVTVSSTDGLGWIGEGEGIAASAVVLLEAIS